jgi:hypothetical protein
MSAEPAKQTRSFRVGRYTATVSLPPVMPNEARVAVIDWQPSLPQRLTPVELEQYRRGRDAALRDLSTELGLNVLVLEL